MHCPFAVDPNPDDPTSQGCSQDEAEDHWHDASQIIAAGDIVSTPDPDLLVKEGKYLWAYCGKQGDNRLDDCGAPTLVGTIDWSGYTVITPGDLNGDNVPDLLLRNNTSGDILHSYGQKDPATGTLNLATWGNNATTIASGAYPAATYPTMGSSGDITGDGIADIWARKTDNTMTARPGTGTTVSLTGFGTSFAVDGVTGGTHIPAQTTIRSGQSYSSRSVTLTMGSDGNLAVTSHSGATLWSTATGGNPGATAKMQSDGNLTVIKSDGSTILWASGTSATNGYALLQDRGNFVVYNAKGQALWAAGTEVRNDYNGDGRSDAADWYDYADGHDTMHTFKANSDGTFSAPASSYTAPAGTWYAPNMKFATGDYNGDGLGDVAILYGYNDGSVKLWTALNNGTGGFNAPFSSWSVPKGNWSFDSRPLAIR